MTTLLMGCEPKKPTPPTPPEPDASAPASEASEPDASADADPRGAIREVLREASTPAPRGLPGEALTISADGVGAHTLTMKLPAKPGDDMTVDLAVGVRAESFDGETACALWISDARHKTADGLHVGKSLGDFERAYGSGEQVGDSAKVHFAKSGLTLELDPRTDVASLMKKDVSAKSGVAVKGIRVGGCPE